MEIKVRKSAILLLSILLAVVILLLVGANALNKGTISPVQIFLVIASALALVVSVFAFSRVGEARWSLELINLALALASVVITLTLVEVGARIYLRRFAPEEQFQKYASIRQMQDRYGQDFSVEEGIAPHRYIGYIAAPDYQKAQNRHNSLGFRGEEIELPKPEGTYRVVCIGGSTTYSAVEALAQTYPVKLEEYLHAAGYTHVEVINAGMVGYTSWESLVNLEFRVLDLEPDLLVIYHAINDVYMRMVWPPEAYRGDNSGTRILRLQPVVMPPVWQYSTALRMAAISLGLSKPQSALDWQFIEYPPTAYSDAFLEQHALATYPEGMFGEVPASTMLETNAPIYFERNLTNMVAIAQANDIDVVLLTFAYFRSTNHRLTTEEVQSGIAEGNEVIRRVAAAASAHLYDFASEMPTESQYFYSDGHHFTEIGNELRAQLIGEYLIGLDILPNGE